MLSPPATARQKSVTDVGGSPGPSSPVIGVGIDTARQGHYAAFLPDDLHQAAPELQVVESAHGYAKLRQRFLDLVRTHGRVRFHVRLDVAGAQADNLLAWLHRLPIDGVAFSISCGDPQRNKNQRRGIYGPKKSDPIEARACARDAVSERPQPMPHRSCERQRLRHGALRRQAVVKQRTRLVNQLHPLLARTFPARAMRVKDITAGGVLELLTRYPTAKLLAQATSADLEAVAYVPHERIDELLASARASIGSRDGAWAEDLVRDQVRQRRDSSARQKRLENLLISPYRDLPEPNPLDTIKGFGEVPAGIRTAFVADIDAGHTPGQRVNYFGVLPSEASSGVDRAGNPRGPKRYVMSRRGNDLVRRYLWMAALSAAQHNPACRARYARGRAKHPDRPAIAIGPVMRKLLHLAFAIGKTGKPFDPNHSPGHAPAHVRQGAGIRRQASGIRSQEPTRDNAVSPKEQAAGLRKGLASIRHEVTAACANRVADARVRLDFAHIKSQLPMAHVLDHLGLTPRLKGAGAQKRCACPIHRGDGRGRTCSVNFDLPKYQCFDARCQSQGDVIDLWAALHRLSRRAAVLDLVRTFDLEPCARTEKRNG